MNIVLFNDFIDGSWSGRQDLGRFLGLDLELAISGEKLAETWRNINMSFMTHSGQQKKDWAPFDHSRHDSGALILARLRCYLGYNCLQHYWSGILGCIFA